MTARARYSMVPASFWLADPATRGLSPLAACLYLRAESESLLGVMAHSPRVLAAAHRGTTVEDVDRALDELAGRNLARWWPDLDTLAIRGTAAKARGRAVIAAAREIAALPAEVRAYVIGYLKGYPMGELDGGWPSLLEHEQSQEHEHEHPATPSVPVASLPLRLTPPAARGKPKRLPHSADTERALVELDAARVRVGLSPLSTVKRDGKTISARLREQGVTLDLLVQIIRAREAEVARNGLASKDAEHFDATGPFSKLNEGRGGWWHSLRLLEGKARGEARGVVPSTAPPVIDGELATAEERREWLHVAQANGVGAAHRAIVERRRTRTAGGRR